MALLGSAVVTRVIGNGQDSTTNQSNYLLPSVRNKGDASISRCQTHDFSEKPGFFAAKADN